MKLIATPDFGLSDIWHFNYPLKNLLSESLKSGRFPLWTDMVGNGFPITAEGQVGTFSPLNWIIFGLLPMPLAFMAAIAVSFVLLFAGGYLFSRALKLSRSVGILAGLFSSLSGYFIVQMTHLNLLQSFSFIPWAFWLTEKFISTKKRKYILWLGMILAQMILVGYPQTFFNTVIILMAYALVRSFPKVISTISVGTAAVGAVLLSAVQVLPLMEFVSQSDTVAAAANQRFIHPLPIKHLLTLINPFVFGDPSRGTYPVYSENWGMFWENMLYVGIIPIFAIFLLLVFGLFHLYHSGRGLARSGLRLSRMTDGILAVLVISLLLSLGKFTPLSFLFKLPPLSFTRISSRFLAFSNFSLGILGAYCLDKIIKRKKWVSLAFLTLATLHVAQISWTFRNYHLVVDDQSWLKQPSIVNQLPTNARIMSFGQSDRWNKVFLVDGWRGKEREYYQNRDSLDQNSNMIFGVKQLGIYAQQLPRRQEMIQRNMYDNDILGKNIRDVFGVTHIIDARSEEFKIIENKSALPDVRIAKKLIRVRDMNEALGIMNQETFNPRTDVLWESEVMPWADEEVIVINRSYYPGWKMYYNQNDRFGYNIKIYPVNINQQAVIVPKDTAISNLMFKYDPLSYKVGRAISFISLIGWIIAIRYLS